MKKYGVVLASVFCMVSLGQNAEIVGGTVVAPGTYGYVVKVRLQQSVCAGVIVGPNAVLTAAHCVQSASSRALIEHEGQTYEGTVYASPEYPRIDHDLALIHLDAPVSGDYAQVALLSLPLGADVLHLGFGCTVAGGALPNKNGELRQGVAQVTGFSGEDVSTTGAALCFGDSGGPVMSAEPGSRLLLAIGSKGNLQNRNYSTRLNSAGSQIFLKLTAKDLGIDICGVTMHCLF